MDSEPTSAKDVARKLLESKRHTPEGKKALHSLDAVSPQFMVRVFHETYGQPIAEKPAALRYDRLQLRLDLIDEEFRELVEASGIEGMSSTQQNLVEMADALGDIVYVCFGMALEMGVNLTAVLQEIHASNLTKLDESGQPIYREDGKVLKGPNYIKPQLARVLGLEQTS